MKAKRLVGAILVAVILVLALVAAPALADIGKSSFGWIVAEKLTVLNGGAQFNSAVTLDDDLSVAGDTTLLGAANVTGALAGAGLVDVGTWLNLSAQTEITVSAGSTITPTGTYQPLRSAAGAGVTTSTSTAVSDGARTGDVLILRNQNVTATITIDALGSNVECKANVTLGAGDALTLMWNGADWNCLAGYDNS